MERRKILRMKQYFGELIKQTKGRKLYDITHQIIDWINQQSITNGLLTLNIQHTSASLLVNENYDADVQVDLDRFFSKLVIDGDDSFIHTAEGDDDMPAHIRTALTQTNLSIPIKNNQLLLGQWQGIFIFEHRFNAFRRKVHIHLIGE